jgi:hypothetical protein
MPGRGRSIGGRVICLRLRACPIGVIDWRHASLVFTILWYLYLYNYHYWKAGGGAGGIPEQAGPIPITPIPHLVHISRR